MTRYREILLLLLLALLWGASYPLIKVAVEDIPPVTLIAVRVSGAALFLLGVMRWHVEQLPRDADTWRRLFLQAVFNSIGAWTALAWGQQVVDAGLASVLNSTSPVFVLLLTWRSAARGRKLIGVCLGVLGVALIVGLDALRGLGDQVAGQLACLLGAALYACAALHGRGFDHISARATATGTMIWAAAVLVPLALVLDQPWTLRPASAALIATVILSVICTGVALLIYFRLIRTLGPMAVASQSYLRAGIGVLLAVLVLGERMTLPISLGLAAVIAGVALINWPLRRGAHGTDATP